VIIVASLNAHKFSEIADLPQAAGLALEPLANYAGVQPVVEDGVTLEENAVIKAVRYSLWLKREHGVESPVVAEDSGLHIEALLGWPGVESARVAQTPEERIALALERMREITNRRAHFAAVVALAINGNFITTWRGVIGGQITHAPRGAQGFGYDPIFEDPTLGLTFAELPPAEKNARSHRALAWAKALQYMKDKGWE
jgi:XTP/dITP diphosphohydrolase